MARGGKRIGRPMKSPEPGKRASLGLKVTAEIKQRIDAAAKITGRSQSQEAELLIERALAYEKALGELEEFRAREMERHEQIARGNIWPALHRLGYRRKPSPHGDAYFPSGHPGLGRGAESAAADDIEQLIERTVRRVLHELKTK
jgi:hypothetical protein